MASANAMARIDWTITCVAEPGFRPTASADFAPIQPTARAAPRAAIPTCRLPVMFLSRPLSGLLARSPNAVSVLDSSVRCSRFFLVMLANQQREDGGQQGDHQRLHETDQQLEKVKGDLHEPADAVNPRHGLQHGLPGKDVAVKTKTERDGAEQDRDDLQTAGGEEHDDHEELQRAPA